MMLRPGILFLYGSALHAEPNAGAVRPPPRKTRSSPIGYARKPTSRHHYVAEASLTVLSFVASTEHQPMKDLVTLLFALTSAVAFAAEPTAFVISKVTKPTVEAVENDPLQADYDTMWADYEEAIKKATDSVKAALDKQIAKATDEGELELVEAWDGMKKQFAESGKLEWDTSPKAPLEWKKKYPKIPYPRDMNEAVRSASSGVASARAKLEEGYAQLVKSYTKAKNISRAMAMRDEGSATAADPGRLSGVSRAVAINGQRFFKLPGVQIDAGSWLYPPGILRNSGSKFAKRGSQQVKFDLPWRHRANELGVLRCFYDGESSPVQHAPNRLHGF